MRCPHQSWREMHQSRIFSIHWKRQLHDRRVRIGCGQSSTASIAFAASGFMRTNHCVEIERLNDGFAAIALAEIDGVRLGLYQFCPNLLERR